MLRETPVKEIARGRWKEILPHFGIGADHLTGNHTGCPICGGKDRFRFDDRHGEGMFFCNQCGAGDGFGLLSKAKGVKFIEIAEYVRKTYNSLPEIRKNYQQPDQATLIRQQRAIRNAWEGSWRPSPDSRVGKYIQMRMGKAWSSQAIRETNAGMIAAITDPQNNLVNVHQTFLTSEGHKDLSKSPNKMVMKGQLPEGSSIKIWDEKEIMGVAEGIESAMSAAILFKMPVWAAVNATLLSKWVPPTLAKEIHIFADNDENFTGQSKAYILANRLALMFDKKCFVHIPVISGSDWNDVLMGKD